MSSSGAWHRSIPLHLTNHFNRVESLLMINREVLTTEAVVTKLFNALEGPHKLNVAWRFFKECYPGRTFPVNEDGWGVKLPCRLEYSVSECRMDSIQHLDKPHPFREIAVDRRVGDQGEVEVINLLEEEDLEMLDLFAENLTRRYIRWLN